MTNTIKQKVLQVMHSKDPAGEGALAATLFFLSLVYGEAVKRRLRWYQAGRLRSRRLPCKVISVGNIAVGGTGKTPMTLYLAERMMGLGYKAVVISRGYRGLAEKQGGIVSDGRKIRMSYDFAGDEPFMTARRLLDIGVPVVVGRKRFEAGLMAIHQFNPDVILLDDAFQHLQVFRDIDLVLLDARYPLGNAHLLPRGILREPATALDRGDIFVLSRSESETGKINGAHLLGALLRNRPVYRSVHVPYLVKWFSAENLTTEENPKVNPGEAERLKNRAVFAFSGLADNSQFRRSLISLGCDVRGFMGFADHHPYSEGDLNSVRISARNCGAQVVCTTEKDFARINRYLSWDIDLAVLGVGISFGDRQAEFDTEIVKRLFGNNANRRFQEKTELI